MNSLTRQLIRASLPARRAILRRRLGRVQLEEVDGLSLVVLPEVFNPVVYRTGVWLARVAANAISDRRASAPSAPRSLDTSSLPIRPGVDGADALLCASRDQRPYTQRPDDPTTQRPAVLDMGTGTGIGALYAARTGAIVTAVDINPEAVRCARINAMMNRLEDRIEVLEGDLFAPVNGQKFDLVLFNPPFFRGTPKDGLDRAWRATDTLERFCAGLPDALAPGAFALVVFSSDGDERGFLTAADAAGLTVSTHDRRDLGNEVLTIYRMEAGR